MFKIPQFVTFFFVKLIDEQITKCICDENKQNSNLSISKLSINFKYLKNDTKSQDLSDK